MNEQPHSREEPRQPEVRCVVCTKKLHAGEERFKVRHGGSEYVVCWASCAQKFQGDPGLYTVQ